MLNAILDIRNITRALDQVCSNKGASGVDGMQTDELRDFMSTHWCSLKAALQSGSYRPEAVRKVEIPKLQGGKRILGIPTVTDRLIQQAISQWMSGLWEPDFHTHSYGFRKGKNAHQGVLQAQRYLNEGKRYVVELDLLNFFDVVQHDKLMSLLAQKITDKATLKLIGKYLRSEIMVGGVSSQRSTGTPQGSPLSPLLGYSFYGWKDECRIRIADKSVKRMKDKLRMSLPRNKAQQVSTLMKNLNPVIRGWVQYFHLSNLKSACNLVDELLRSRVRKLVWQKWQKVKTRMRNLINLGIPKGRSYQWLNTSKGASRVAHSPILQRSMTNHTLGRIGRKSFFQMYRDNVETQLKFF